MDKLQIVFGTVSSVGAIAGIYFHIRNKKKKETKNQININGSSIKTQTIQQADKIINNNIFNDKNTKTSLKNRIDLKSDCAIRDYINHEMKNMSLVEANFDQLAKKFINASIDWIIIINKIEKSSVRNYKVYFTSDERFSRMEYFLANLDEFPILKFAKKGFKYRIEAQIKEFDEIMLVLDRVTNLQKL